MSRAARRRWGRMPLQRTTRAKTMKFFELYREGFSRSTIAAKLGATADRVDQLSDAMEEDDHSEEKTATVGGGG